MSGLLLDTNVVSEMTKNPPHPGVVEFLQEQRDLWLSVMVIHELEVGIQKLPRGTRRNLLSGANQKLLANFSGRILGIGRSEAEWAASFRVRARRDGWMLQLADALIAGTAKARDLSVVTRNVKDFDRLGVEVINPWECRLEPPS